MHRISLVLLAAVLVGLASDGATLQQVEAALDASMVTPLKAVGPRLVGPFAGLLDGFAPGGVGLAVASAALTTALGLAALHLSWWAGLLALPFLAAAWCAVTLLGAAIQPGIVLIAALAGWMVGGVARRRQRPEGHRGDERPTADQDPLMPVIAATSAAAIVTFDREGAIRSYNQAAESMFGYELRDVLGTPFRQLLASDEARLPSRTEGVTCELRGRRRIGQDFDIAAAFSSMDLGTGRLRVAIMQDITALQTRREARELHDPLTGLPQDVLFADRTDQAILVADRASQPFALLLIHLKMLRMIRETFGDAFGDRLLGLIVARLREGMRRSDTLARIGDVELGLLLPSPIDAETAARKAEQIVAQLDQSLTVDDIEIRLEAHIGLATYPRDGRTTGELRQRAEIAMLAARRAQRAVLAHPDAASLAVPEDQLLVDQLRAAIEDGHFFLEFLPKVDLESGAVQGVEALARWRHPERGMIPAETFITIAERHGLVLPLSLRIIALALEQLQRWPGRDWSIAVNLSVELLESPQFPLILEHICAAAGGRAEQLLLEISERALSKHSNTILHVIKTLKDNGCQIALDNFGTGSLSLPLLQRLPVVEVKIDRAYVTAMAKDEHAAAVVRSATSLAASLGVRVVAVGVEDEVTLERLVDLGCSQAQGFYIGPPMTAAKLEAWLSARPAWHARPAPVPQSDAA